MTATEGAEEIAKRLDEAVRFARQMNGIVPADLITDAAALLRRLSPATGDGWRSIAEATRDAAAKIAYGQRTLDIEFKTPELKSWQDGHNQACAAIVRAINEMPLPAPPSEETGT